ncbi:fasciclin-like arabinogalactan protein 21 [Gastrolobium bilobum]|uniref:fasciclin-like arabinogalactan protein 21 n=1 Tax=Gastrolobium bilobum TaxID=150636 RepID=UPI002AB238BB|nr:fasciclin-like arabinogalactan protein 21 [Gastrolobium bilobum]
MASSCCCSFWFPVYFVVSVTLGVIAICSAVSSSSKNSPQEIAPITHDLSMNASFALRRAGFIVMADLLHRSPQFFLPPQNSTIFAIKDSAIRNTSLPLWFLKNLLLYHTSTSKASMQDLLNKTPGSCIPTLFRQKNVAVTKVDHAQRSVEINHVLISNPDIFLGEQLAIHGVLAPFSSLHRQDPQGAWDFIHSAACRSNSSIMFDESKNVVEWNRIVQFLSSKGYASFSIALHSVLDGIQKDSVGLGSATIFAPPDLTLLGYPSTFLHRAVRLHILPQRFNYTELTSLPVRTLLKTLVPDDDLEIDGVLDFIPGVVINGVEIVAPDMLTSEKFVVHGISRAFKMAELIG